MIWQHVGPLKATSTECNLLNLDSWFHWQQNYRQPATEPNPQDVIVIVQTCTQYNFNILINNNYY